MHQELTKTRHLMDTIGFNDISGNFHSDEYERVDESKQAERLKVMDFILSYFPTMNGPTLYSLSLPGQFWIYEHMLLQSRRRVHIVGLEKSSSIFHKSYSSMAAGWLNTRPRHRVMPYGNGEYQYVRTDSRANRGESRSHRYLNMELGCYLSAVIDDFGQSMNERKKFSTKFHRRNAVWLDFTCPLSDSILTQLVNLPFCIRTTPNKKPVVLTFMYGRDRGGKISGRTSILEETIPSFVTKDAWTYKGKNGTPMITIAGEMV